ncbi:MAG: PEP-CTERM sorting domain-containing protein [Verrucomicrobiaceae bacterium]|nr:MAG: PEP-CTERM sorting domain-containing protein [Verrucomicrobiaceae bacterium]
MKQTNRHMRSLLLASLLIASASVAGATVMNYAGTFSATFPAVPTYEWETALGIPTFAGSWSFEFDDEAVVGVGWEDHVIDLETLSLNPSTINVTEFNLTNSKAQLTFNNGVLYQLFVGGLPFGITGGSNADDFGLAYDGETRAVQVVTLNTTAGFQYVNGHNGATGSFNPTAAVPEPSSALLGLTALAGFLFRRSRRA